MAQKVLFICRVGIDCVVCDSVCCEPGCAQKPAGGERGLKEGEKDGREFQNVSHKVFNKGSQHLIGITLG